jgi:stage V sporulation protein R
MRADGADDLGRIQDVANEMGAGAEAAGLDPGPVEFQLVPSRLLESVTAYGGVLTRIGHWSFGKSYRRLHLAQQYHTAHLYELVVPTRPPVAYLLETTPLAETRLVVAHVLGHADFFHHHIRFRQQPPDMPRRMRVWREWMEREAPRERARGWEAFLDDAQVLADLIDPYSTEWRAPQNVLGFIIHEGSALSAVHRHALEIVEQEARFVRPALETKIANEGWATYWHRELIRRAGVPVGDALDAARLHAEVVAPGSGLNPYALGLALWEAAARDPERPWRERVWTSDTALVERYLDRDMAARCLAHAEGTFATVRQQLLRALDNGGIPRIEVGGMRGGTLELIHRFDGRELDWSMVPRALAAVSRIWQAPVELFTTRDDAGVAVRSEGWSGSVEVAERTTG